MDVRLVLCAVIVTIAAVEARIPPRPACLIHCPGGFIHESTCECYGPNEGNIGSACNLMDCGPLSTCVERYGRARCVPSNPTYPSKPTGGSSRVCYKPKDSGHCFGYFPRYYFNSEIQRCQSFVFGGCGGNSNNFRSLSECRLTCDRGQPQPWY